MMRVGYSGQVSLGLAVAAAMTAGLPMRTLNDRVVQMPSGRKLFTSKRKRGKTRSGWTVSLEPTRASRRFAKRFKRHEHLWRV